MDSTSTVRWAQGWLWAQAEQVAWRALAAGALQPIHTTIAHLPAGPANFLIHQLDGDGGAAALDRKLTRSPFADNHDFRDFNPFLPYDPALFVADISPTHLALLNKFPVMRQHMLVVTRAFAEQDAVLDAADFAALWACMGEGGTLGFYSSGNSAGASQRHKHLQWIPGTDEQANLRLYLPGLPQGAQPLEVARHPALPLQHCFVRIGEMQGAPVEQTATTLHQAFQVACSQLGLAPDTDGCLPACNLLVGDGWLLLIPRSQEMVEGISLSAICFGGALYLRQPEQMELVRREGPLKVLGAVGYPL